MGGKGRIVREIGGGGNGRWRDRGRGEVGRTVRGDGGSGEASMCVGYVCRLLSTAAAFF